MSRGESLTEADRAPWLRSIADAISLETRARVGVGGGGGGGPDAPDASAAPPRDVVVACSALKRAHRDVLASVPGVETRFIFLSPATREAAAARLRTRAAADPGGHFAGEALLASQLADLESDAASFEGHHVHRMRAFGGRGENEEEDDGDGDAAAAAVRLLPIRPRSRGARRSLRTFPVVTLHPRFPFNV
jgi:gluconate kinase